MASSERDAERTNEAIERDIETCRFNLANMFDHETAVERYARWLADMEETLRLREELRAVGEERDRLKEALGTAIGAMERADWSNGVTDSTGTIDEGNVRFCELRDQLLAVLAPTMEGGSNG